MEETVGGRWQEVSFPSSKSRGESGDRNVILPTREVLRQLVRSSSVAEAMERAETEAIVTVLPVPERVDGKNLLRIPNPGGEGTVLMEFELASTIKKQ